MGLEDIKNAFANLMPGNSEKKENPDVKIIEELQRQNPVSSAQVGDFVSRPQTEAGTGDTSVQKRGRGRPRGSKTIPITETTPVIGEADAKNIASNIKAVVKDLLRVNENWNIKNVKVVIKRKPEKAAKEPELLEDAKLPDYIHEMMPNTAERLSIKYIQYLKYTDEALFGLGILAIIHQNMSLRTELKELLKDEPELQTK